MLDLLKILFCIPFLLYSCYSDIRTRRVSNRVWLIMLFGNLFFILYDVSKYGLPYLYDFSEYNFPYLLILLISFGIMYLFLTFYEQINKLLHTRMMGGADAKFLLVISIMFPVYPTFTALNYDFPAVVSNNFFAFSVLGNAVISAMLIPISLFIYNLSKYGFNIKEISYFFQGYRTKISELHNEYIWIIQDFDEVDGKIITHHKRSGAEINGEFLFSWDKIPGPDNERLVDLLDDNFDVKWIRAAKIEKINDNKTIRIFTEKNSIELNIDNEKSKVFLKIDNVETDELFAKLENNELNIYDDFIMPKLKNILERGLIKDEIWVTPKLPFMIPLTVGFFISVLYGDIVFQLISNFIFG